MTVRDRLARRIQPDFTAIGAHMARSYAVPGHDWQARPLEHRWWKGNVLQSTRNGASVMMRRCTPDDHDQRQLHIELRLFWCENDRKPHRKIGHRAILWVTYGGRICGHNRSILASSAAHLTAPSIEALIEQVDLTIAPAIDWYLTMFNACAAAS